jgi:TolA-binding protein
MVLFFAATSPLLAKWTQQILTAATGAQPVNEGGPEQGTAVGDGGKNGGDLQRCYLHVALPNAHIHGIAGQPLFAILFHFPGGGGDGAGCFGHALDAYKRRQWQEAQALFRDVLQAYPADQPARSYLERCKDYKFAPPPEGWDGVFEMQTK